MRVFANFDASSACITASETSPACPWTYFQAACGRLGGASEERQPLQHGSSECSLPSQRKHATMGKGEGAKNKTSRQATTGTADVKIGMAKMLKGGVIMDVIDAEQARIVRYPCRLHFKSERCAKRAPKSRCANALAVLLWTTARRRRARAESDSGNAATRCRAVDERSPPSVRAVPKHKRPRTTPKNHTL